MDSLQVQHIATYMEVLAEYLLQVIMQEAISEEIGLINLETRSLIWSILVKEVLQALTCRGK